MKLTATRELQGTGELVPPTSNTGENSRVRPQPQEVLDSRIDALTLHFDGEGHDIKEHIQKYLSINFDDENPFPRTIGLFYELNYQSAAGSLFSLRSTPGGYRGRLSISGSECGRLGSERLLRAMGSIRRMHPELKCSRIDVFVDDYSGRLQWARIEEAINNGQRKGFRKAVFTKSSGGKISGWTIGLGCRDSDKYVRIYDKWAESDGKIPSVRWETEYKGDTAEAVLGHLIESMDKGAEVADETIAYAIGRVGFIYPTDKNLTRCENLEWWDDFLRFIEIAPKKPFVVRVKSSLARTKKWIEKSVAKTLALLELASGGEAFEVYMQRLLLQGRNKMKLIDELKLLEYLKYPEKHYNMREDYI